MTQNPIHKVLSTLATHKVKALLMGGQACIMYGAAEFSRDTDIAILASDDNIELLREALRVLKARRIAVPPFDIAYLRKGHAIHFRSYHPDSFRARIDVISKMRGVDNFEMLWERRVPFTLPNREQVELISLPDLVQSKKTQRDKDWPMIRRLVESDYAIVRDPSADKVKFWLLESRTPLMIIKLVKEHEQLTGELSRFRPLLEVARAGSTSEIEEQLDKEEQLERSADCLYWSPLFRELERLRHEGYDVEEEV